MPLQKATFAAGCFWHVQHAFDRLKGVKATKAGYTGGKTANPSYKEVCTGTTGHAEAVEIEFDEDKISYEKLLETFFTIHDPTQKNSQGPDIGTQYRSAIFYHDKKQKKAAEAFIKKLESSKRFNKPIATELTKAPAFYPAEEYHQKYFEKHPAKRFLCGI
ncbi:peptide-methionine (S)-S-oxide reductase MsrA [Candidatus Woesearchaeota archaeon]|nr:peptide-methionine (S)-S-oxide reductase MsrA [Candidatus Woesearchaeota archaeon]